MGARQSKRLVDITTTPKKGDNETAAVSEDKIEKLGDADVEVVKNGTAPHTDIEFADKDDTKETKESDTTEVKENGLPESSDGEKTPDKEDVTPAAGDQPAAAEIVEEKITENGDKAAETPDSKKPKDKKKKKWSLRSISFSKKDKSKPGKEKEKNGEVEDVNEEKEEETPKTPTEAVKTDESKEVEEVKTDSTTKDANTEEVVVVKTPEVEEPTTEAKIEVVATPIEPPTVEATKEEETPKPVEQEECTKPEKVEETTTIAPSEEVKEVRNEELPPPLPNSNPPSQVAVFAESLKDDPILITETHSSPVVETQCQSVKEPVEAPLDVNEEHPDLKVEPVIESSGPAIESTEPVIESSETVIESSEPANEIQSSHIETPPEIQLVKPQEEASEDAPIEKLSDKPAVVPDAEDAKLAGDESIASKNDPVIPSDSKETDELKPIEQSTVDVPSASDSSPIVIETLSKLSEETIQSTSSNVSVVADDSALVVSTQQSETPNLADEVSSLQIEENPSSESVQSVPLIIEEKLPVVSSAGDVPDPQDSQISFESNGDTIPQELKSSINLKEASVSQESNISEEQSVDLSTIPEAVESSEIKLAEDSISTPELSSSVPNVELAEPTNSLIESQQEDKDQTKVETLCNADSLADLSTESLPSLPEPTDSVLEPMSLPPLDFLPDPLVDDNLPVESHVPKPNGTDPEVVLTNGNATNGLKSSPTADDGDTPPPPPPDGPLKQQVIAQESTLGACEISKSSEEKTDIVESAQTEAQ